MASNQLLPMLRAIAPIMVVSVVLCFNTAKGQKPKNPRLIPKYDSAEKLYWEADVLRKEETYESRQAALAKYRSAAALYASIGSSSDHASTLYRIGSVLSDLGYVDKALENLSRSLRISKAIKDDELSASDLDEIGSVYLDLDEKQKALECFESALILWRKLKNPGSEAGTLSNIGVVRSSQGDRKKALELFKQALSLAGSAGHKGSEATALGNIATMYDELGEKQTALEYYERALKIATEIESKDVQASVQQSMGALYAELGQPIKALEYYVKVLKIRKSTGDVRGQAETLVAAGNVLYDQHDYEGALEFFELALPDFQTVRSRRGEAGVLNNIALVYFATGDKRKALGLFVKAVLIDREIGNKAAMAVGLYNIGAIHHQLGEYAKALEFLNLSLPIRKEVGGKSAEASTLATLGSVWQKLGNARLSIFYSKQAVNLYQEVRASIKTMDKEIQSTYLNTVDQAYKNLADQLIAAGRLTEAQEVLAMLKQEEVYDYLRRDASEVDKLSIRSDLRTDESAALKRYNAISDKVALIGVEFGQLQMKQANLPRGSSLPAAEKKRYDELSKQLEDANTVFQVYLRQLADEFAAKPKVIEEIRENSALQADLKSWGDDVVALYTVINEDRYRVILTTPDSQTDGKTEIKVAALNKKINDFRIAVQDPSIDPRPLGKELYDILVKPIEKQLTDAKTKTILWSLDGTLRYLPMAALWDGNQYFGQKYQNVVITLASRTRLSEVPKNDWRILGLGVTGAKELIEPNGTRAIKFAALTSVRSELTSIVRDEQGVNESGILAGKRLLDADFTEQSMKDGLGKGYQAVHIASHFSFRPGDMTRSFLLLGDGKPLTMDKVKTSPQLKFNGIELLTLSACDTAVGETNATGSEVESFAVIAQQNGARAVLATLWPVADESTSLFMSEFYRLKNSDPQMSKSQAIRLVQKAMLEGKIKSSGVSGGCRAELNPGTGQKPFKCDPNASFSHPYFWSPFVLIGNWR